MHRHSIIRLPRGFQQGLEASAHALLNPANGPRFDFSRPWGERALIAADSLSWRIFKNPITLLIGGLAAVILELAEPAVRAAIWEHSSFRSNPMLRLQRTGLAAMVTVYGAQSVAERMIARVAHLHSKVFGTTPDGLPYAASDSRLLSWVQATASFGFAEAYSRYVRPLDRRELDTVFRESLCVSELYGALEMPSSSTAFHALLRSNHVRLHATPAVFEFLSIMRTLRGLPAPLSWIQGALVRAAVDVIPEATRARLGLTERFGLRTAERWLVMTAAATADRICLSGSPPVQACLRLGLPASKLFS
jgi:uncharacterized protein (DUF2236 family)